jgi:Leucyl aminopeptidase
LGTILKFSIINAKNISWESDQLLVFLVENNRPSQYFKKWQSLTGNNINNIIENTSFSFKFGQDLLVRSSKNSILLFGYGTTRKTNLDYEKLGGILFSKIDKLGFKEITIISNLEVSENKQNVIISKLLLGFKLKSYSFLKYKKNNKINTKKIEYVKVLKKEKKILEQQLHLNDNLISGIFFSKDLTFEPPNFLTPQEFVNQITSLEKIGIEIEVLNEKNMDKLGMHALLGVGRGSAEKSYLVIMKWNGSTNSKKNIAYVGKRCLF